jgi:putative flippase GtrA
VRINFRRWGVFNAVGLGGYITQIAALAVLIRYFGWPAVAATAAALELAALQNFVGHSLWTFGDRRVSRRVEGHAATLRGWLRRYWRYQVAKTASLGANLAITTLIVYAGLPAEIANTAAVLACAIPNYLVSEHLVFGHGL